MKLLMITRKVDRKDHLAGFTYRWVERCGKEVEHLYVICLEARDLKNLPPNISVFGLNTKNKLIKFIRFQFLAFRLVPKVDGIFCHMNPEYTLAIAPAAKIFRKKIISWYVHKSVTFRLRALEKIAHVIITASKESFRLPSKKLIIVGHGIDIEAFRPLEKKIKNLTFRILSVGRISPTKDYETMIQAMKLLRSEGIKNIRLDIVGAPGLESQTEYYESLLEMTKKIGLQDSVYFLGPIPNYAIVNFYQNADLFLNLSHTGSLDKTVLEAMSCECLVLTSNEAFSNILGEKFMVRKNDAKHLASKILEIKNSEAQDVSEWRQKFRSEIVKNHNLSVLIKRIVSLFQ